MVLSDAKNIVQPPRPNENQFLLQYCSVIIMDQNPKSRQTMRLPDWDYRSAGYYFITICTSQRENTFKDKRLYEIAANTWQYIPNQPHARHVKLDEWVVMPNHLHGILNILEDPETPHIKPANPKGSMPGSIGTIVGNFKMLVTKRVKKVLNVTDTDFKLWQRGCWERIIRNERELMATREYIVNNPHRWQEDRDNLDQLLGKMRYVDPA